MKKVYIICLKLINYQFQPVCRDDNELLVYFDTEEEALADIQEHADVLDPDDYFVVEAELTGEVLTFKVEYETYIMKLSDEDATLLP